MKSTKAFNIAKALLIDVVSLVVGLIKGGQAWMLPLVAALLLLAIVWVLATPAGVASFIYPLL